MNALKRLFGEGFRVFFLAAGLYAVFVLAGWLGWLSGRVDLAVAMPPQHWHGHELIFGYATAALGGFFLTAVPNWTGAKAARHAFIAIAAGVWLSGRLAMWWSGTLPAGVVALADLAFLPILGAKIATQLIKRPKPQNMMFLVLLAIIWGADLTVHLEWMGLAENTATAGLRAGLYGLCAMIAVLGGRVTPAFTRNAMLRAGQEAGLPVSHKILDLPGVALAIALPVLVLLRAPDTVVGVVALLAGLAQIARVAGWRPGFAMHQPILWALHLSFFTLGLGLVLTGLARLGVGSEIAALHLLAIGGVAGMTLAVMTRAALGHSGRPLVAPRMVAISYILLPLAAGLRWLASAFPAAWYGPGTFAAGGLWMLAFVLYLAALWPAFWGPKQSGKGQ
ncbi:MAG: NnrS family protein [Paracoccaceae bacterium]|nr:NnrS family protein [Paracoccaceae bacterium]